MHLGVFVCVCVCVFTTTYETFTKFHVGGPDQRRKLLHFGKALDDPLDTKEISNFHWSHLHHFS